MALSSVTLGACGHVAATTTRPADPIIETVTVREVYCPPDLWRDPGQEPEPSDDAVVTHNAAGGEYLDGLIGWGQQMLAIITASRQACADKGAAPQ